MARGRKPKLDPPVNLMVSIPQSVASKLELLLFDPLTQKPSYGGRSALVTQLIIEWIEKQKAPLQHPADSANLALSNQEVPNGTDPSNSA